MASFRQIRQHLAPRWLTEGDGGLIGYSLDLVKDAFVERVRLGHLARFPQQDPEGTPAPDDAIAAMGRDRRVVRGINETVESYALRLLAWLDDRRTAGNAFALMQKLAEYTGPGCVFKTVDAQGNWYVRAADGTRSYYLKKENWEWDDHPIDIPSGKRRWSRFWVIIHPPGSLWVEGPNYDDAGVEYGNQPGTWGSTATVEQVRTIRAIVSDWKPAGTRCVNIIVAFDPDSFDPEAAVDDAGMPNFLWEHWSINVGGVQVPARLSTARYWDGV
jgi:hypothetical protein